MEFYVIRIRFMKDGTTKKSEIITKATLREAEAKLHNNLGIDMADDTLSGGVCMILDIRGKVPEGDRVAWGQQTIIETETTE